MIEDFPYLVCRNDNGDSHVNGFCLAALVETDRKIPMTVDQPQKIDWSGSREWYLSPAGTRDSGIDGLPYKNR